MRTLILSLLLALPAAAQENAKCVKALNACIELVEAQDTQIEHLKANVAQLQDKLASAPTPDAVPDWAKITIALVLGLSVGYAIGK